jgi:pimeloyl-ACP methyl ester carboxylesterase
LSKGNFIVKGFDHTSGEYLTINGANIYYEVIGETSAPVLLFLHGGFGHIENFNNMLAQIAGSYKIIGIDSRGQGKSSLGSTPLTYERLQNDVEAILKHLNISQLAIMGFSDGGIIGYRLACLSRVKVTKLVTIGSRWHINNAEPIKEICSTFTTDSLKKSHPDFYQEYQQLNPDKNFDRLIKQLIAMWFDQTSAGHPNHQIENISCPVLMMRGEDDRVVLSKDVAEAARIIKNSQLVNIPSAGHAAFEDQLDLVMENLNDFLSN